MKVDMILYYIKNDIFFSLIETNENMKYNWSTAMQYFFMTWTQESGYVGSGFILFIETHLATT